MEESSRQYRDWYSSFDPDHTTITGYEPKKLKYKLNMILFILTIVSTLIGGTLIAGVDVFSQPWLLYEGIPYSFSLLFILGVHELGHYFTSKKWGVSTSLPYFIPLPPIPFVWGTLGAFIKVKSRIVNRKALIDIGAAGPLLGFVPSVAAVFFGMKLSTIVESGAVERSSLIFGESLLFSLLSKLALGPEAMQQDILLHPIAVAGWLGLFVTALNLLPLGQLDGGHIAYALFGRKHRYLAGTVFLGLFPLGFYLWPGWFLWILIGAITGWKHPPPVDDISPLDFKRKVFGMITLTIFVLCFIPVPFKLG